MLNWDDYKIIVAIHEAKSLSAAGRSLNLNQSTISRILKRIESTLGESIFSQTDGYYKINSVGTPYLLAGREMAQTISKIKKSTPDSSIFGLVKITTIEAFSGYLLSRISIFKKNHPFICIEINGSNKNMNLSKREFHLALGFNRDKGTKFLLAKKVADVAITGYKKKNTNGPMDWIGYESNLHSIPEEKWLNKYIKKQRKIISVSSYNTMEIALQCGLGKGLLPTFMGEQNENLERISESSAPLFKKDLWFLSYPETRKDPAVNAVANWIIEQMEQDKIFFDSSNKS